MTTPAPPNFAAALDTYDPATGRADIPPGWGQGRATFGGLLFAQALRAARLRLPEPRPARALAATFPAPLAVGAVEVAVRELRHGRAVSQLASEVRQGDELGCLLLAAFGGNRPSSVGVEAAAPTPCLPPDGLPPLIGQPGSAPEFTAHFDYRLAFGAAPYSGSVVRELGGWCRFRDEVGPLGEEHVAALLDAWPSPAVVRMRAPAPAATITWSLELLSIEPEPNSDGWWLYRAESLAAADGYEHTTARLWSPAGRLAALSRQAVAVFA